MVSDLFVSIGADQKSLTSKDGKATNKILHVDIIILLVK